ncbi:hypothetical protein E4695_15940 [Alcaligenaceae bacterium 429]|nr:hypothetical protein E4695_15940 [Alcaligenaceae bacterium 429]
MKPTQTEGLLRQAQILCQNITDRVDVSDELLHAVFERLCMEQDMQEVMPDPYSEATGTIH